MRLACTSIAWMWIPFPEAFLPVPIFFLWRVKPIKRGCGLKESEEILLVLHVLTVRCAVP